jgi:hypothetical protein
MNPNFQDAESHCAVKTTEADAPKATKAGTAAPPPHSGHADARLRADAQGRHGGVRQELAARVITFRSGATRIGLLCPWASRAA